MTIHPKVMAAYLRTLEAESADAEFSTVATKRAVTRAANTLSKKIKEFHPNLDMQQNIALRTKLQELGL
jgi:hypothetical protein